MIKIDWTKASFTTSGCLPVYFATDGEVTHIVLDRGSHAEWLLTEKANCAFFEMAIMDVVTRHCDVLPWHEVSKYSNVGDAITAAVLWEVDGAKPFGRAKRAAERLPGE